MHHASLLLLGAAVAGASNPTSGDAFGATQLSYSAEANYTAWRALAAHANATGSVSIGGYDVTGAFPQTAADVASVPWNLTVRVVADVPALDSDKYLTGAAVTLDPPPELQGKRANDSWATCFSVWSSTSHRSTAASNTGCGGFLSQKCIKALQGAFADPSVCATGGDVPDECGSELATHGGGSSSAGGGFGLNHTLGPIGQGPGRLYGPTAKGNTTFYDDAIRQVWVVGYSFTRNVSRDGRFAGDSKLTQGNVSCLHAGSVAPGSRTFEEGAGAVLRAKGVTAAVVGVAVVLLL